MFVKSSMGNGKIVSRTSHYRRGQKVLRKRMLYIVILIIS